MSADKPPYELLLTASIILTFILYWNRQSIPSVRALKGKTLGILRQWVPWVRAKVDKEKNDISESFFKSIVRDVAPSVKDLPKKGLSSEEVLAEISKRSEKERPDWTSGSLSGAVYNGSEELDEIFSKTMGSFSRANLLHSENFPAARQMEAEVVSMTIGLFNGDKIAAVGSVTTGGTESLLLAVKSYRDWGREVKKIHSANIVVSETAHAAFWKAGDYFNVEVREARCDRGTGEVDLKHMEYLIDSNTVAIVGSAPNYPYGTIDNIEQMSNLAIKKDIGLHVDACLGGFLIPFVRDALPYQFDFKVPGVTSISADTHKYGYAPKGTSILMWKSRELRKFQFSFKTDWLGGVYATPTISGSRAAAPVAACWAVMRYFGSDGYERLAKQICLAAREVAAAIKWDKVPGIKIIGRADVSVVAFSVCQKFKKKIDIYDVCDRMKKSQRHWHLNLLQNPAACHITVTAANLENVKKFFVTDLVAACEQILNEGKEVGKSETAAFYGATASAPLELLNEIAEIYLHTCYRVGKS